MKIDSYSFGHIEINGRAYISDVIVYSDRVDSSWWRKEGHSLFPEDIVDILNAKPDILILGTGFFGMMTVPKSTLDRITSSGIEVRAFRTVKAVELFNALQDKKSAVIAAFHITC